VNSDTLINYLSEVTPLFEGFLKYEDVTDTPYFLFLISPEWGRDGFAGFGYYSPGFFTIPFWFTHSYLEHREGPFNNPLSIP